MCDLYGEETATIWNVSHPKARTEHQCNCCGATIPKGDNYALTRCLYDRRWTTEKACVGCATVINEFGEEHRFYPSASTFQQYLSDCVRGDDDQWAAPLAFIEARQDESREAAS